MSDIFKIVVNMDIGVPMTLWAAIKMRICGYHSHASEISRVVSEGIRQSCLHDAELQRYIEEKERKGATLQ